MRLDDIKGPSMWLSFCDSDRPKGTQFLGAAIVPGAEIITAVKMAHVLGCNPGGEVQGLPIPPDVDKLIADTWRGRLLSREDCERFDAALDAVRALPRGGRDG